MLWINRTFLEKKNCRKCVMNKQCNICKLNVILFFTDATTFKHCHVVVCLKSLAASFPRPLPPINWVLILTPFLQQNEGLWIISL